MTKLYLTSFRFQTGEQIIDESFIVVVNNHDRETNRETKTIYEEVTPGEPGIPKEIAFDDLDLANEKAKKWFKDAYPESTLIWCIAKQAIE